MKPFTVYILHCADGSYYCGHTDDLDARLRQHEGGVVGYTAERKPFELAWMGEFETRVGALEFERQVKGWSRAKKEALIRGDWEGIQRLARSRKSEQLEPGLRQAQPERRGGGGVANASNSARPEPPNSARPEPPNSVRPEPPNSVRPEPVEGPVSGHTTRLRQAQPEREGEAEREVNSVRPELVEGPGQPLSVGSLESPVTVAHQHPLIPTLLDGPPAAQRRAIAKAITLLESTRPDHRDQADAMLTALLPGTGGALRLGISGVPGVGKSTFIEALGLHLIDQGHRVAVLAVDPSSSVSGGSILGDKTRMERLSVHERAYIRPSPSRGALGGVAEKTREAMLVCEAAGFDVVIVETVGVGQSELAVAGMTDMFVLLQLPNAGDDLQAIKKGVMELADLVVVNKADLDADAATRAQAQIGGALHLLGAHGHASASAGDPASQAAWRPKVIRASALQADGIDRFWAEVEAFRALQSAGGQLAQRRRQQSLGWMWERIDAELKLAFRRRPAVAGQLRDITADVAAGRLPASVAARRLLRAGGIDPGSGPA